MCRQHDPLHKRPHGRYYKRLRSPKHLKWQNQKINIKIDYFKYANIYSCRKQLGKIIYLELL